MYEVTLVLIHESGIYRWLLGSTAGHFALNQGGESKLDGEGMATSDDDDGLDVNKDATQEKNGIEECLGDAGPENGPVSFIDHASSCTRYSESLYPVFIAYILTRSLFSRTVVSERPPQVGAVH